MVSAGCRRVAVGFLRRVLGSRDRQDQRILERGQAVRYGGIVRMVSRTRTIFAAASIFAILAAFGFFGGCIGNSSLRIRREHGLVLPPSASRFVCKGDAWKMVLDRG